MNRYESGQLKDRCGLHLSSWSCLPVGWRRLWLGVVNIPSHTVILARFICLRFFMFTVLKVSFQPKISLRSLCEAQLRRGVGFRLCDSRLGGRGDH